MADEPAVKSGNKVWYIATGLAYAFSVLNVTSILDVVPEWVAVLIGVGAYLSTHFVRGMADHDGDGVPNYRDPDYRG